jgi:ATP-dependent phosphofructokinase / diphosphate-dependent phosphofructokinase
MSGVVKGNAVIGQSGGPTAVINQSLAGVIEAMSGAKAIGHLLGAHHGVRGIVEEQFIDLKGLNESAIERIATTPASALGSTRDKPDEAYCHKIFKVFEKNHVEYFFYIGGNDSADTARIVNEMAIAAGHPLRVFHIPKTIDNDLLVTDHCPGYGSAAKFVACAMMGDDRDSASLPGIKIDVIMGRHAGWLTAASVLARQDDSDGPHLVYVPESPLSEEQFVNDVAAAYSRHGRCLVAVSEGIELPDGMSWGEHLAIRQDQDGISAVERDSHGNVQLSGSGALGDNLAQIVKTQVAAKLGGKKLRVRADTLGYLQRSFPGFASPVDAREARMVGRKAVQYALAGEEGGSVALRRKPGKTYGVSYFLARLRDVARNTKPLPREFITPAGNGICDGFFPYARPLVGKLPAVGKLF